MKEVEMGKELVKRFDGIARFTRIESRETGRSIPDYQVRSRTADWWVELKRITEQHICSSGKINIPWRGGQLQWMKEHDKYNGHCAVVINYSYTFYIITRVSFMHKSYDGFFHLEGLSEYHGTLAELPDYVWEMV